MDAIFEAINNGARDYEYGPEELRTLEIRKMR